MPMYEYDCPDCGLFESIAAMSMAALPARCPECTTLCERVLSAPRLALMPSSQRRLHERNEKSAHEPRRSKHLCGPDCSHGKHAQPRVNGQKPAKRPWMLGH